MTTKLTPPKDLDLTKPISPTERRMWEAEWAAYRDALRAEEDRQRQQEAAAESEANRPLSEDEYFALSIKLYEEQQAKLAEREAAEQAKKDEEAAYLRSLPEVAEVSERSEYLFLSKLGHWLSQGYVVTEDSIRFWMPGMYHVALNKPALTAKRSK
jgi:type IV secretory pathway VirB10-like protein